MPQHQTCVRCGSLLPGSGVPVGFEPPRAGRIEKSLRLASVIRILNRLGGRIADCLEWGWQKAAPLLQLQIRDADLKILSMFWKGLLPGLAQWYIGRQPQDKLFFFGWLLLLLLTFLTFGLPFSNILLGFVISWHLCSIIDVTIITCRGYSDRIFLFSIMVLGAVLLFYVPTSTLCWNHLGAQSVNGDAGPLRNGDTLLYTRSWATIKPQVGDIVLYTAPQVNYQGNGNIVYRLGGNMFDRVLALERQTVSWHDGKLTIDGTPSPYLPFVPIIKPPNVTFVVPEGQCYIVPGVAFRRLQMPTDGSTWSQVGLVPYESLYGSVWGARRSFFHFVNIHSTGIPGEPGGYGGVPPSPPALENH